MENLNQGSGTAGATTKKPTVAGLRLQLTPRVVAVLVTPIVTAMIILAGHFIFGVMVFILGMVLPSIIKIGTNQRGLITFGDKSLPWAVDPGYGLLFPIGFGLIIFDTKKDVQKILIEDYLTRDGVPISFKPTIVWQPPTHAIEGGKKRFGLYSPAQALLNYQTIKNRERVIELFSDVCLETMEPELSSLPHDKLTGIHINAVYAILEKSTSLQELEQAIDRQEPEDVTNRRLQITQTVTVNMAERLMKKYGIVILDVIIPDFNFPRKIRDHIEDVFLMKIQKATEVIDLGVDVRRALLLVGEASKLSQEMTLMEAYAMIRGWDIKEIIANNSGPIGKLINGLADKLSPELSPVA